MPQAPDSTLLRRLAELAVTQADKTAYVFLEDGEREAARLSYAELDARARGIAALLLARGACAERVLLLYPPGLAYIEAFLGCLYAGAIAVPAYPPTRHHLARLRAVVADARPKLVLSTSALEAQLALGAQASWGLPREAWLASDAPGAVAVDAAMLPEIAPERLAFLQYTSGSTGDPRGVMVSHANLLANQRAIAERFEHGPESLIVGWLPLYHDMGLIGNVLQPLYLGVPSVLMSPLAFLTKPVRWLRAISRYRATTSGAPNFAYDHCTQRISDEERAGLDLHSWRVAFNGAEPVRAQTLERFAARFAAVGFERRAFYPCYGLAEATLLVCGPEPGRGPQLSAADAGLVGCGRPAAGHGVCVVDPETRQRLPTAPKGRSGSVARV